MSRILVIDGHPNPESLSAGIVSAYAEGARGAGAQVDVLVLRELDFDVTLHRGYRGDQALEPDLLHAQRLLVESDHLVIASPVWWGSVPAPLKGFLDRVLQRGWAFKYTARGIPVGLLAGRSARLLVTTDSPRLWLSGLMGDSMIRQLKRSTLWVCGYRPVKASVFGPVHGSDDTKRTGWLVQAEALGRKDAARPASSGKRMPEISELV